MTKTKNFGFLLGMALGFFCAVYSFAFAAEQAADPVKMRINIAGQQRMLSQRMSKAVCYAVSGFDTVRQAKIGTETATRFTAQLNGLLNGSDALGLQAETNPEIRAALTSVDQMSDAFVRSVQQLAAGDLNTYAMQFVIERNLPTLVLMNEAVGMIARANSTGAVDAATASTINKAGRQRMLSQRMAKDICLIAVNLDRAKSLRDLAASREMFDMTLKGLQEGNEGEGLLPPPTAEISAQLTLVAEHWHSILPALDQIEAGAQPDRADLIELITRLDVILVEMNRAVSMWSQS